MKNYFEKIFIIKRCNKTNRILAIIPRHASSTFLFVLSGILSIIWILSRVITKPSRIYYPCIRAAAPIASSFLIYMFGSIASFFTFKNLEKKFKYAKQAAAISFLVIILLAFFYPTEQNANIIYANTFQYDIPNKPIGEAKGVMPGRVVWSHNFNAVNQDWNNNLKSRYYDSINYNTDLIQDMINQALLMLTGKITLKDAWSSMFEYFNNQKGNGLADYKKGEKIFIKINMVGSGWGATDDSFNLYYKSSACWTSPPVVLVIIRDLVNVVGVPQEDISVGDPMQVIIKPYYDIWSKEFPDINYVSNKFSTEQGRVMSERGIKPSIFYSDRGKVLRTGNPDSWDVGNEWGDSVLCDTLYTVVENADYIIDMAALKTHERAGVTLCAKNFFGVQTRENAKQLHMGLVSPNGLGKDDPVPRFNYGMYRILVDLMGHKKLGRNTLLFFIDGLWGGTGASNPPEKYRMPPFYNRYPSSVFLSMDNVAIESVCLDFLKSEFTENNSYSSTPQMQGIDDYLMQAADSAYWPKGIVYDPENDGIPIPSLGVFEHWNNSIDKKYSRNLGTGNGIELIEIDDNSTKIKRNNSKKKLGFLLNQNYPNPFNPSTVISFYIPKDVHVTLSIYDTNGKIVNTLLNEFKPAGAYNLTFNGSTYSSGIYYYCLIAGNYKDARKMILLK